MKKLERCDVWLWDQQKYATENVQYNSDVDRFTSDNYIYQVLNVEYKFSGDKMFIDLEKYKIFVPANSLFIVRFYYGSTHPPIVFWMSGAVNKLKYEINEERQLVTDLDFYEAMPPLKTIIGTASNFAIFATYAKIPLDISHRTETEMLCYQVKNAMIRFHSLNSN